MFVLCVVGSLFVSTLALGAFIGRIGEIGADNGVELPTETCLSGDLAEGVVL